MNLEEIEQTIQEILKKQISHQNDVLEPIKNAITADASKFNAKGMALLKSGKVGAILIAGGQGTRLNFLGPKGCFPISIIKNKSLFQLFCEKTAAASKMVHRPLKLAIMTSPLNHDETLSYFEKHHYFGLNKSQISFFQQGLFPMATEEGKLLFLNDKLVQGPDGNGVLFHHFVDSGLYHTFKQSGIEHINIVLVDNPLADPFDLTLLGAHQLFNDDVTIKCIEKENPLEKVGILVLKNGEITVAEYSELSEEMLNNPHFKLANISLYATTMAFIKKAAVSIKQLPWHTHLKRGAWKFEKFIFDNLQFAKKISLLSYPREQCFAPLKSEESIHEVKRLLQNRDREILKEITQIEPTTKPFELDPLFYYPNEDLKKKWIGKTIADGGYITA